MMVMGVACVSYGFLQVGAIGTTFGTDASMAASDDGKWDDNRRLNEDVAKRKGDPWGAGFKADFIGFRMISRGF